MKKIEFAPALKIETYQEEVTALLLAMAKYMIEPDEDAVEWLRHTFVSDESCIGDFLSREEDVSHLSTDLNLPALRRNDCIFEVAETLYQRKNPN